jgi:hypothetical protein
MSVSINRFLVHLFLACPFARSSWATLGLVIHQPSDPFWTILHGDHCHDVLVLYRVGSGSGSGRVSAGFGFSGFGFGACFPPTVSRVRIPEILRVQGGS